MESKIMKPNNNCIMNKYLKISFLLLTFLITLSSCSNDEPSTNEPCADESTINNNDGSATNNDKPATIDNYYVKYVIKCSQNRYYVTKFSVNTDKGIVYFSDYLSKYWTQTYGPVKKGFTASATAESTYPTIEIYVSKNNEPFALKATNTKNTKVTSSYTIDF
jgi:hypothetical protein